MSRTLLARTPLLLALALTVGACDGLFKTKEEAPAAEAPAAPVEPTSARVAGPSQGTGPWKVIIAWNRDGTGDLQVPDGVLERVFESSGVKLLRVTAPGPVSVLDANGQNIGTVDVPAITDLDTAWILAESGRPPTFLSPLPPPILVQQAGAYFKIELPEMARPGLQRRGEEGEGQGMRRLGRRTNEDGTPVQMGGKGMKARPKLRGPGGGDEAPSSEEDQGAEER